MSKITTPIHYAVLVTIVVACAVVSAFTVHSILVGSLMKTDKLVSSDSTRQSQRTVSPTIQMNFPQGPDGTYILPTADPTYPLRLGPNTVGGVTACERLNNLKICLQEQNSSLAAQLRSPEATAGAGLDAVCGNILNEIADLRPQSVEIGCIW
jgi:hypothetical protein